jgi:streptogramin lyase
MISRNMRSLAKLTPAIGLIAAAASPLAVVEYKIPRERAFPHDPAVGADGIVWYTDQQNSFIGRLDPATGKITDYPTPTPASGPHGIVVAPDGGVWYTAQRIGKLGRLDILRRSAFRDDRRVRPKVGANGNDQDPDSGLDRSEHVRRQHA